jgi:hypothetical protein
VIPIIMVHVQSLSLPVTTLIIGLLQCHSTCGYGLALPFLSGISWRAVLDMGMREWHYCHKQMLDTVKLCVRDSVCRGWLLRQGPIAQTGLKHLILLPQLPECWDYKRYHHAQL